MRVPTRDVHPIEPRNDRRRVPIILHQTGRQKNKAPYSMSISRERQATSYSSEPKLRRDRLEGSAGALQLCDRQGAIDRDYRGPPCQERHWAETGRSTPITNRGTRLRTTSATLLWPTWPRP